MRRLRSDQGYLTFWLLGLAVMLLSVGGLSLDLWRAFSERRELAGIVDGAAAAGSSGIDERAWEQDGQLRLDRDRAADLAWRYLNAYTTDPADVAVAEDGSQITVRASRTVELTLSKVLLAGEPLTVTTRATSAPRRVR